MDEMKNSFEILGLKPGASPEEIKQAYRDLVRVWHPDRYAHDPRLQDKVQEKLKEINEAFEKIRKYQSSYSKESQEGQRRGYQAEQKSHDESSQGQQKSKESKPAERSSSFFKNLWIYLVPFLILFIVYVWDYSKTKPTKTGATTTALHKEERKPQDAAHPHATEHSEKFAQGKAFNLLFDNSNEKTGESIWTHMFVPANIDKWKIFKDKNTGLVSQYIFYDYEENGKNKYILITSTIPTSKGPILTSKGYIFPDSDKLLSGFVFVQENNNWLLELRHDYITFNSEFITGYEDYDGPPNVKSVRIGPHKIGIAIEQKYGGSGASGNYEGILKLIIFPTDSNKLSIVKLGGNMKYEETKGYTEQRRSKGDFSNNDYEYFINYEFIKNIDKDYYDIRVNTKGTDFDPKTGKVTTIDRTYYYKFVKGRYVKTDLLPHI